MKLKGNTMVIDTETVGDFGQPLIHDIGYQIVDENFNVLVEKRFLIKESRLAKWALNSSNFYKTKAHLYDRALEYGEVEVIRWKTFCQIFGKDLSFYKVKTIGAYNIAFDYRALKFTNEFFGKPLKLMKKINRRNLLCLWNLSTDTMLNTNEFKTWALENNFISKCGNYSTSAETCFAYMTQNETFEEEHTALEDVKIEVEILKQSIENYEGVVEFGLKYGCWRKVQDKKQKEIK
jgi:hypothetical protein